MLSPVVVEINTCARTVALEPRRTADWDATTRTLDEFPCASSLSCCSSFFAGSSSRNGSDEPLVAPACAAVLTRSAVEPPRPCPAPPTSPPNACPLRGGVRFSGARPVSVRPRLRAAPAPPAAGAPAARVPVPHLQLRILDFRSAAKLWARSARQSAGGDSLRRVKARACSTSANTARKSGSKPSNTTLQCAPDPTKPPLEGRCIVHSRRKRQESVQRPQLKRAHG